MGDYTTVLTKTTAVDDSIITAFDQAFMISNGQEQKLEQFVSVRKDINAKTINMPVYARLAAATTPLVEGEDPVSVAISDTKVVLTPVEYGNVVTTTSLANLQTAGMADLAAAALVGINAGITQDQLILAAMAAGTTASGNIATVDGGAAASLAADDVMSRAFVNNMYRKLRREHVPFIGDGYVAVMHEDVIADIRADVTAGGWVDVVKYATPDVAFKNEVGKYYGFRVVSYSDAALIDADGGAGAVDNYASYFFGANFLGKAVSKDIGFVAKPAGDKLNRLFNLGWYGVFKYGAVDGTALWKGITSSSFGTNV